MQNKTEQKICTKEDSTRLLHWEAGQTSGCEDAHQALSGETTHVSRSWATWAHRSRGGEAPSRSGGSRRARQVSRLFLPASWPRGNERQMVEYWGVGKTFGVASSSSLIFRTLWFYVRLIVLFIVSVWYVTSLTTVILVLKSHKNV